MSLILFFHPLASFCHKVQIALYENETPFEARLVDLGDQASSAELLSLWPLGKIPLLQDTVRGEVVPETSVIIEYLDTYYAGSTRFLPQDPELALQARLWDRFFDNYVQAPMQKIVLDTLRPEASKDPAGVAQARAELGRAYDILELHLQGRIWAVGQQFSLAECAAAPALFYAGVPVPFADRPNLRAYFERLMQRPSYARALSEARPYFSNYPLQAEIPDWYFPSP